MATATPPAPKRQKPKPDILRDARRIRDILQPYRIEERKILVDMAAASLDQQLAAEQPK